MPVENGGNEGFFSSAPDNLPSQPKHENHLTCQT